ncbi:MAG: hypothetical protein HC771_00015 [Synechococcales cyanobacterium CRU_2_2]|nr:hypothetical protein [Synechococcales cyanobacterium CRU_2_2]
MTVRKARAKTAGLLAIGGLMAGALALSALDFAWMSRPSLAQTLPSPPRRPSNTLAPDPQDALLPANAAQNAAKGKLPPADLQQIRVNAARLDQEANAAYQARNIVQAYGVWFRALRLLQYAAEEEEIVALGRIGAKAWGDGLAVESQAIAQRLLVLDQAIAPQTKTVAAEPEPRAQTIAIQEKLALAHEQVGALDPAIARYEWLLAQDPLGSNQSAPNPRLITKLAQLNLARLNYPDAARYTAIQREQGRSGSPAPALTQPSASPEAPPSETQLTETQLTERLAYIYEQNGQWEAAIAQQQKLLERYSLPQPAILQPNLAQLNPAQPNAGQAPPTLSKRPALLVAIGVNQAKAGFDTAATQTYQAAYREAQAQQQFGVSHEALANLALLYEQRSQHQDTLTVYTVLLRVDELSYNVFGLLQTYENMGQLQVKLGDRDAAQRALSQALHLAKLLDYRVTEIQTQLAALEAPSP